MKRLYHDLYQSIRNNILTGKYAPGTKLPSSRSMAADLGVCRNTVLAAFSHLEAEGFIEAKKGSGVYVNRIQHTELPPRSQPKRKQLIKQQTSSPLPFYNGGVNVADFPFHEFARLAKRSFNLLKEGDYSYGDPTGYYPFKEAILSWLTLKRGIRAVPEQIIITNGSQEGIFLCAMHFHKLFSRVIMENPCYQTAKHTFKQFFRQMQFIAVDDDGMQIDKIKTKNALVYLTPSHQFPGGQTMSIQRRLALLQKASQQNLYIVEDDFDSDFRYKGEPISSLQGYDTCDRVVYTGSFSKILFPALRLGYIILPLGLVEEFKKTRTLVNRQPSVLNQSITAEFIRSGRFFSHIRKMKSVYAKRKYFLETLIQKELHPWLTLAQNHSGLQLVAYCNKQIDKQHLIKLSHDKLNLYFLSDHTEGRCKQEALLFPFAGFNEKQLREAVLLLKKYLAQCF